MAQDSNKSLKQVAFYVGIFMVGVYFIMGLSLIFTNVFLELIPSNRLMIGLVIIAYAIFRLYMARRIKQSRKVEENND